MEATTPAVSGVTTTSYTLTGLSPGGTYFFKVAAIYAGGSSTTSNEATAALIPLAATGLKATGGSGEITLGWTASVGAKSYSVFQGSTSGGEGATPIATGIDDLKTRTLVSGMGFAQGLGDLYPPFGAVQLERAAGA